MSEAEGIVRDEHGRACEYVLKSAPTDPRWIPTDRVAVCGVGAMPGDGRYEGWRIYHLVGTVEEGRALQDDETISWWNGPGEDAATYIAFLQERLVGLTAGSVSITIPAHDPDEVEVLVVARGAENGRIREVKIREVARAVDLAFRDGAACYVDGRRVAFDRFVHDGEEPPDHLPPVVPWPDIR